MEFKINLPDDFEEYFKYISKNFFIDINTYLENIVKDEIESRNRDLKLF